MALLRDDMGEHAAAATLMREALVGRRRVLGENHPSTQTTIAEMDVMEQNLLAKEEVAEEEEEQEEEEEGEEGEEEEEETMY
jgi:hypothetical protein